MKTIMMALLITSLLSCTTEKVNGQVFNRETNYKIKFNPTMLGLVAGGGFIVAGLLTKPERKWVQDNTSQSTTFYGQQGHWRNQYIYESQSRMSAIISGALIIGLSFTLNF